MLLKITEKCSLGCTHCVNNAKPNGKHMSFEVLKDTLDFIRKTNTYQHIIITGGEPTEHPEFVKMAKEIINFSKSINSLTVVTITTNGFWILQNPEIAKEIACSGNESTMVSFQVSTDSRYYPKPLLDKTKRIWREPGFILCEECVAQIYPLGRAKENNYPTDRISSHCFNIRAISKQLKAIDSNGNNSNNGYDYYDHSLTFEDIVRTLVSANKFCTPTIRINGDICLGESDLCKTCSNIYKTDNEIVDDILQFKCHTCDHINNNLPEKYKQFLE